MKIKLFALQVAGILLLGFLLSACSAATVAPTGTPTIVPTATPIVVTDGLERQISLPQPAQRIVSLAPSNTEILFAIGAGSQVVGRDEFSNYPQQALDLPAVGGSFGGYNEEAIVSLNPDLILAAEINTPEQVKSLEDLGLTVYLLPNPTTLEEMYENLKLIGRLTGQEANAKALVEALQARVAAIDAQVSAITDRPKVFYELDGTDPSAPYTAGAGTFIDLLITRAGGENIGAVMGVPWGQLSIEQIVIQDPEIILLGDAAYGVTVESVGQRAGWENLKAVKNGRVFPFNDDLLSRPGPRLVDGLEALFAVLHPEVSQ